MEVFQLSFSACYCARPSSLATTSTDDIAAGGGTTGFDTGAPADEGVGAADVDGFADGVAACAEEPSPSFSIIVLNSPMIAPSWMV
jgi:hypothetical protein